MSYLFGLVGHPVEHSLSPPMHKAALSHLGLHGDYVLVDVPPETIEQGIASLVKRGFAGFQVTIPHKRAFLHLIADLTPQAQQAMAVNTIKIDQQGRLIGHNTDIGGFTQALTQAYIECNPRPLACILGAGGGARAALCALAYLGWSRVYIMARNQQAAFELVEDIKGAWSQGNEQVALPQLQVIATDLNGLDRVPDLVVNCTPVGLNDQPIPEWMLELLKWMNPEGTFFDMVYSRSLEPTALVKEALRLRLNAVDGKEMLLRQAALAFEYWTGRQAPVDNMRAALLYSCGKKDLAKSEDF